jgi:nicotinamidase-related amidase
LGIPNGPRQIVSFGTSGELAPALKDGLLIIDVFNDFDHEDGHDLLASFQERVPAMVEAIAAARVAEIPIVYVNDQLERWDADAPGLVRSALAARPGGEVIAALAPEPGDRFVLKPRYSAFDHTALALLLQELEIERILLIGSATEGCVVQTGIDAREAGFKVTIVADACATNDSGLADIALRYAQEVGGMRISDASSLAGEMHLSDLHARSSGSPVPDA